MAGSIDEMLEDLENAAQIPARQRTVKISNLVDRVCSTAYEDGLHHVPFSKLVDIITLPSQLDQRNVGNLVKNLYPTSKVADSVVIKVVNSLGHGQAKPSLASQAALLKWLVMVYDVLENQKILSLLYAVLFNLLGTIAIRSPLCHVLSLITRRRHVRPFRIQVLMELTRQVGNDPPLVGLMRVYKDYYPDVIVGDATAGRASVFTHPNTEWRQHLGEIQDIHFQKTQVGLPPGKRNFKVTRNGTNGVKQSKNPIIPEVYTSHAQPSSTTLEEIGSIDEFVRKLEKITLPNQLVAVIGDPLLQKFLQLKSSDNTLRRIDNWLLMYFEDQLQTSGSEGRIVEMLGAILAYTHFTKHLPPACLTYIISMMSSWNGVTGRQAVLGLLAYTHPAPFEELRRRIFAPLEHAILDGTIASQLALLTFYTNLLDQWAVTLLCQDHQIQTQEAIASLISHVNTLSLSILQTSSSVNTHSTVLRFYESVAFLLTQPSLNSFVRITIPPAALIYTLQFTHSLNTLSRLCSVLAHYKRAFEYAIADSQTLSVSDRIKYPKEYTNHFNGFLMDVCNCLWRSRAFSTSDPNALGCLIPPTAVAMLGKYVTGLDTSVSLPTLFSLSYSPVVCLLAISYVRELEDDAEDIETRHAGPVTQASLKQPENDGGLKLSWATYRLGVLRYLENNGGMGIGELMYNTMKHLISAREKAA